jgi:enoyl-CoA hydratase/carnithine racemase
VVSAVDGYALGGGNELQMACAWRVAGARAELGQPEINLHVIPGFGGTQMLPRLAVRRARAGGGQMYTLLVEALDLLLDGRRRPASRALALGLVDELAPSDALSHALGIARRIATGEFRGALGSPLTDTSTVAFPNVERDADIQRLLGHHAEIDRRGPAAAILEVVRVGLTQGLEAGLALEARRFGELVASEDGRAGIDRFFARRSWPLPLRREDA